jgi:alpha-tubulin suppressor-like RCC1 family protein
VSGVFNATAVSAGASHTLLLLSDHTVKAFGYNYYGQLGDGSFTNRNTPVRVSGL